MKLFFVLATCISPFVLMAQTQSYEGTYSVRYDMKDGSLFEYQLQLRADGTFFFHAHEIHTKALKPEKNRYGKGKWTASKNLISLTTNPEVDLFDNYTLNFTNTKARIDRQSVRNKSADAVPDSMRIYDSDIFWIKGLKLTKESP
jgi:hypothetical protein